MDERQGRRLDRDGDIETLMGRLGAIRVRTYIAHRGTWLDDARGWQGRTRAIEDRLSDALHGKLLARFVDRRATGLARRVRVAADTLEAAVSPTGEVTMAGQRVARIRGVSLDIEEGVEDSPSVLKAARKVLGRVLEERG